MPKDDRDILEVLKFELAFLEKGGYGRSTREPWRAPLIFEDSLSCMNYDSPLLPRPCSECVLMQFVPEEARGAKVPCRHIPITPEGATVNGFYQWGSQHELEEALGKWLRSSISRIEAERAQAAKQPPRAVSATAH